MPELMEGSAGPRFCPLAQKHAACCMQRLFAQKVRALLPLQVPRWGAAAALTAWALTSDMHAWGFASQLSPALTENDVQVQHGHRLPDFFATAAGGETTRVRNLAQAAEGKLKTGSAQHLQGAAFKLVDLQWLGRSGIVRYLQAFIRRGRNSKLQSGYIHLGYWIDQYVLPASNADKSPFW